MTEFQQRQAVRMTKAAEHRKTNERVYCIKLTALMVLSAIVFFGLVYAGCYLMV